jgi:hypothetical protein
VVMSRRWRSATEDPVEQIGVSAIEQSFESVELGIVEAQEGRLSERAENKVALLSPAMPASKQQSPASNI